METSRDNLGIALDARAKGISAIPVLPGSKVPAVKWKQWQTELPPEELLRQWFEGTRCNIAIVTSGMVVFDVDDLAKAELVLKECGDTSHKLRTPGGGMHLGYRKRKGVTLANQVKIKGHAIDIRTDGGIEMIPDSVTDKGAYQWIGEGLRPVAELPVAHVGWTRTRVKRQVQAAVLENCEGSRLLYRGRKYIDTFDRRAVSGANGHTTAFVAALKIVRFVRMLGGGPEEAWQLLLYYNASKCDPPWDLSVPAEERALRHKLEEALKRAR